MKITNIKLSDLISKKVYSYIDKENEKINEIRLKESNLSKNSGYFLITGKIKIADGTEYPALLGISSKDSGEMFEAHFLVNKKWISQKDKKFLKKLNKEKSKVFPYKYHLNVKVIGDANTLAQY